jgi:hypothetical protein
MNYFNTSGHTFTMEINKITYRFVPKINRNLPDGLDIATNNILVKLKNDEKIIFLI